MSEKKASLLHLAMERAELRENRFEEKYWLYYKCLLKDLNEVKESQMEEHWEIYQAGLNAKDKSQNSFFEYYKSRFAHDRNEITFMNE